MPKIKKGVMRPWLCKKIGCISLSMALMLCNSINLPAEAVGTSIETYLVQRGDTLSEISQKYDVALPVLMAINNLKDTTIIAGNALKIPTAEVTTFAYEVQPGDNLITLARRFGTPVESIKAMNGLDSSVIKVGDKLTITLRKSFVQATPAVAHLTSEKIAPALAGKLDKEDIYLLAKLIHAEARGESFEGKVAVGAVILNRLQHPKFPGNIREIIYQKTKQTYQFTPVQDGKINLTPNDEALRAAEAALRGSDPTGGALFFYNPKTASDRWIRTLPVTKTIGNHVFAR